MGSTTRSRSSPAGSPSSPVPATTTRKTPSYYQPVPPPRWWKLTDAEHGAAVDRLRAWVEHIYRPGYGKMAATLPPCWEHHPLCLYMLDWLSELWSVLYLRPDRTGRTLAAQGEWQTRLLPAAAEQMAYEATGCQHTPSITRRPSQAGRADAHTLPPPGEVVMNNRPMGGTSPTAARRAVPGLPGGLAICPSAGLPNGPSAREKSAIR